MAMNPLFLLLHSLLSVVATTATPYHPSIIAPSAPLHPHQYNALKTMNIQISTTNPCSDPTSLCDDSTPFRQLVSLSLSNCPYPLSVSSKPLQSLSTLTTLKIIQCPFNLQTNSTPLLLILDNLRNLTTLTISHSNLNESLPEKWPSEGLTDVNLSNNHLEGKIPGALEELFCLKSLSLESNNLSGHVPRFIVKMQNLRYFNLKDNNFNDDDIGSCRFRKVISWSTRAVNDMAFVLSAWILVIMGVMLIANCRP